LESNAGPLQAAGGREDLDLPIFSEFRQGAPLRGEPGQSNALRFEIPDARYERQAIVGRYGQSNWAANSLSDSGSLRAAAKGEVEPRIIDDLLGGPTPWPGQVGQGAPKKRYEQWVDRPASSSMQACRAELSPHSTSGHVPHGAELDFSQDPETET
jgi:hypothetical protein